MTLTATGTVRVSVQRTFMTTYIHQLVERARARALLNVVGRLRSGWLIMGEKQVLPGYCLLLPDPVVVHLNDFSGHARTQFLLDMAEAGDALLAVTGAVRINYEMLGNLEPALHAHLVPRFADEPDALRTKPVWFYDWNTARAFDPKLDRAVQDSVRRILAERDLLID